LLTDGFGGRQRRYDPAIVRWLLLCCALVAAMVVVGGATRLTRSGLSIVEWKPIAGAIPPLSQADWQEAFDKYRQTPEYKQVNKGMSLEEFKGIFWWEYLHRLLGRLVGLVFLVPLVWFWLRGRLDRRLGTRLLGVFVLGGLQGAMGWYMVKSGLVDDPKVSHLRLAAHLGLAFAIYGVILWLALGLIYANDAHLRTERERRLSRQVKWIVAVASVMVLSGALVAGLRAGYAYNTFPLMNGHVIPPEIMLIQPWWRNFFYNMATVQFDHRLLAYVLVVMIGWFWWRVRNGSVSGRAKGWADFLLLALLAQILLGITTLLYVVPVWLGVAHQAGALVVFTAAIGAMHALRQRGSAKSEFA
jgi:cytochrome c oxidase assembly protein subunit 15